MAVLLEVSMVGISNHSIVVESGNFPFAISTDNVNNVIECEATGGKWNCSGNQKLHLSMPTCSE